MGYHRCVQNRLHQHYLLQMQARRAEWATAQMDENGERVPGLAIPWPVHEVGRNADIFDEDAGRLLRAGSWIVSDSVKATKIVQEQ